MMTDRPKRMLAWAHRVFGPTALRVDERVCRFVEEAIELAQASGVSPETLHKIVERVYSRPAGEPGLEFQQCCATLETYAALMKWSVEQGAQAEWSRVQTLNEDELRDRHRAKVQLGIAGYHDGKGEAL